MSLFSALMIITVSVLGSIEISIQDEQKREQLYQTYLSQKDISDYKSAIFLFPGREEGYQQFLESIMEDGQMDRQEHQELMSLLFYTESDLQDLFEIAGFDVFIDPLHELILSGKMRLLLH